MLSCSHALMLSCSHALMLSCSHALMLSCSHALMLSYSHALILSCSHPVLPPIGSYRSLLREYASIPRKKPPKEDGSWFTCSRCRTTPPAPSAASNPAPAAVCYRCCECVQDREVCEACFTGDPQHSQKHRFQMRTVLSLHTLSVLASVQVVSISISLPIL